MILRSFLPGTVFLAGSLTLCGCTAPELDPGVSPTDAEQSVPIQEPVEESLPVFISLLPWGEIDFSRGQFPSFDACNAFVRTLPGYSGYTTPERCEPLPEPVYCTRWQEGDDSVSRIGCFKGIGGCEIELRRHDLLAENDQYSIIGRCEAHALNDAWALYQTIDTPAESSP